MTKDAFSEMQSVPGDEIFHFYRGDPVEMLPLHHDGSSDKIILGNTILEGHHPQVVVPGGSWQGSKLIEGGDFALMGTTMSPGFEFSDYTRGRQSDLSKRYFEHTELIATLTSDIKPK